MANSKSQVIDKVVRQARLQYEEIIESEVVSKKMLIDGVETRGQIADNKRATTVKEALTKTVASMLNVKVQRGSHVKISNNPEIEGEYDLEGVVISIPSKTPVDYYYSILLFNTTVTRHRQRLEYDEDGYIIGNNPLIIDEIPCFVQRVGARQRQIDIGIDRDSVNEITTTKDWDIQKDDILYIGSDRYKVTDIQELDTQVFSAFMTYYRE